MAQIPDSASHSGYESQFSTRYGSGNMRALFSERENRLRMRKVWTALAYSQMKASVVSKAEFDDIKAHAVKIDIERSLAIEEQTRHDVVAEIRCYSEQCKIGGGKIHLGATSEDILGNAQVLAQKEALALIRSKIEEVLKVLAGIIRENASKPAMAYTHLQPAEPTTIGYRFSVYAQDLLNDLSQVELLESEIRGKGFKGAVGTGASYYSVLEGTKTNALEMEAIAMDYLGLSAFDVSTQTYPRKQDYRVLCALAQVSQTLAKMAFDFRILQSPLFGELSEPFGSSQVGSSAMPFKRNPINCEKICSLARLVQAYPQVAIENADYSLLERTLDDSANRRVVIPEAFLATDEMLIAAEKVLSGLSFDYTRINKNFNDYAPFSGTERLLAALVKKGADRQAMHEAIRDCSMKAWESMKSGKPNSLLSDLLADKRISKHIGKAEIAGLLDVSKHTGYASIKAEGMARRIEKTV